MKFAPRKDAVVYRMHTPRYASVPTSGAGAAAGGGRANRPGVETLYLSFDTQTAIEEYAQVSSIMPPGTLVSYRLSVERLVDFCGGYDPVAWDPIWEDFFCDWRELCFNQGIEPPSWVAGDLAIAAGAAGILFPSRLRQGGINLALFTQRLGEKDSLVVYDPDGVLPRDQRSWDSPT